MATNSADKKPFHKKGMTTFIVAWTFLVLVVTGGVLYASPKGRVAHWTDWTVFGLDKEEWGAVHVLTALAFVLAGAFHIYFNWTVFVSYFKKRVQTGFHLKREFAVATGVTALVLAGTILNLPPFSQVLSWSDDIKDYWEAKAVVLPYAHAEESSLEDFCAKVGLPVEGAITRLQAKGYEVPDASMALGDLARLNGTGPSGMFSELLQAAPKGAGQAPMGMGAGIGRKTLQQLSEELGIEVDDVLARLRSRDIEANADLSLREAAKDAGMMPKQLLDIISNTE